MTFHGDLRAALLDNLGPDWLVFMPKWAVMRKGPWTDGKPKAIMLHHSAAAATASTNPSAPGNQKGANANVIGYIQNHPLGCPAANFSLDRDGTVYVHSAYRIYHAGLGSFRGKAPWSALGIADDMANQATFGVEIIDKGLSRTSITEAQKDSLVHLMRACRDTSGWPNIGLLRRPQHRDWTSRKVDLKVSNDEVAAWILKYGFTTIP